MMRSLPAAAVLLLISTVAAPAYELICSAPRVALGDDSRDNNPVVSVEIRYVPDDHAWRIFHKLRNGLVVSRSEQYAIQDASGDRRIQWQGTLNRARNLYMIGEVRSGEGGIAYMEWLYDRHKNNLLVMQASAHCSPPLPQPTPNTSSLPQPTPNTSSLPQPMAPYNNKPAITEQNERL